MKTQKTHTRLQAVLAEFGHAREALLPCLKVLQDEFGCVPRDYISYLVDQLHISPLDIYGVISFHGMLTTRNQGKYVVRLCSSLPCHLNEADGLIKALEDELEVPLGQTTRDGLFTLEDAGCLGACDRAPALLINDMLFGPVTPAEARAMILDIRSREAN